MNRQCSPLAALLSLSVVTAAEKTTVVLVGDDDYPPYSYKDPAGNAKGLYADT